MDIVFFDFDKTITNIDTLLPFAIFLTKKRRKLKGFIPVVNSLVLLRARKISNTQFKEDFVFWLLKDEAVDAIHRYAEEFLDLYMHRFINLNIFTILKEHLYRKDEVCIVSANFTFFLAALKRSWNLADIVATEADILNGAFTGRIRGKACHGKEKLLRVIDRFGEERVRNATAYGDSRADLFLLNYVERGMLVLPRSTFLEKLMAHINLFLEIYFRHNGFKR